VTAIEST